MGMATPGKCVIWRFARVEMSVVDPGKRMFLGFARVEMGVVAPGKREFWRFARGARKAPNKRHSLVYARSFISYESKARRQQYFWRRTTFFSLLY